VFCYTNYISIYQLIGSEINMSYACVMRRSALLYFENSLPIMLLLNIEFSTIKCLY
jgi:hypothetical protein